jgi:Zn-dependent protease with chaperone function
MSRRISVALLVLALFSSIVLAQAPGRETEREKAIWAELQAIAPGTVEDFKAATAAMDEGNCEEAVRLFEAIRTKTPGFDPVVRRLGMSLVALGKTQDGFKFLDQAVKNHRSPENLMALARTLAYPAPGKEGSKEEKRRAYSLIKEAGGLPQAQNDSEYTVMRVQLALELDQVSDFRSTTESLVANHPDLMATHYYDAILAAYDEKWIKAEKEIKTAESLGLPHEVAEAFLDSGVRSRAAVWHYLIYALCLVAVWMVGLLALFLIGKLMSRKTLRSLEPSDPNEPVSGSDVALRKWYRRLINLAGFYYYISIPVVMFLVLAVAGSITYGFLMLGRIPIKLVAVLGIGALITIYTMIRSLFVKVKSEDPGRSLQYDEAPGLWDLTRTVAAAVGTRPVDEIQVTPGTDLAVYEKGSFRERSQDKARRILILGVGVLNDFKQNGFRAVLAHEYGHFSHRDTAGGDVAIRVNNDMIKFAHAMVMSDQAVWWNVAFHFLRIYHFIFRRISHGATRLQEVLADRVAAINYGPLAFEEGLTHVVRKSVEFNSVASREVSESLESSRALQNLYELQADQNPDLEEEMENALKRETSEDDTHPSPNDRFRLTRKVSRNNEPPASGLVWELFKNREALTSEMTSLIQGELRGA